MSDGRIWVQGMTGSSANRDNKLYNTCTCIGSIFNCYIDTSNVNIHLMHNILEYLFLSLCIIKILIQSYCIETKTMLH